MVELRDAIAADLPAILAITNDAILHSDTIWLETPLTLDQRRSWWEGRRLAGLPVIVAVEGEEVLGFGSYGTFRAYEGYALTVEHSVYVARAARRRGIGAMLLDALVTRATQAGLHVMIGAVTASNGASVALHERAGFIAGSVLPEIGRKHGRWLDLVFMYRRLGKPAQEGNTA